MSDTGEPCRLDIEGRRRGVRLMGEAYVEEARRRDKSVNEMRVGGRADCDRRLLGLVGDGVPAARLTTDLLLPLVGSSRPKAGEWSIGAQSPLRSVTSIIDAALGNSWYTGESAIRVGPRSGEATHGERAGARLGVALRAVRAVDRRRCCGRDGDCGVDPGGRGRRSEG